MEIIFPLLALPPQLPESLVAAAANVVAGSFFKKEIGVVRKRVEIGFDGNFFFPTKIEVEGGRKNLFPLQLLLLFVFLTFFF